jgi:ParB-like chromosome segregation protein Spo0J
LPQVEETPVVHKHFVAPALIPLERVDADGVFLMRHEAELDDVAALATDIARLGQLFPIDVRLRAPDRFQVITGFRRVAALRFLQREKVLARLHTDLSDSDAMLMSLASAIHSKSVGTEVLAAIKSSLETAGRLTPPARDMLEKALATEDGLAPEEVEEEVDADELAADVTLRLGQANQDLSLLADVFAELDEQRREELLKQLRYSVELVAFLESKQ